MLFQIKKTFLLVITLPAAATQDSGSRCHRLNEGIVGLHGLHIFLIQIEMFFNFFGIHTFVRRKLCYCFLKILMLHKTYPQVLVLVKADKKKFTESSPITANRIFTFVPKIEFFVYKKSVIVTLFIY